MPQGIVCSADKTSIRPLPQDTASGSEVSTPPRDSQPDQPLVYHLCHSALSVPRTKTSSLPDAQELTPGPDVSTPPRDSQPDQPPLYHLCHSALSVPRTKTSIRPLPHDTAAGSEVSTPPRYSQPDHPPLYHLCQSALLVPLTNTSSLPFAQEQTAGPEVSTPPEGFPARPSASYTIYARERCRFRGQRHRSGHWTRIQQQGSEVITPPRDSQPDQPPLYHLCQRALSVPRTNMSSLPCRIPPISFRSTRAVALRSLVSVPNISSARTREALSQAVGI